MPAIAGAGPVIHNFHRFIHSRSRRRMALSVPSSAPTFSTVDNLCAATRTINSREHVFSEMSCRSNLSRFAQQAIPAPGVPIVVRSAAEVRTIFVDVAERL